MKLLRTIIASGLIAAILASTGCMTVGHEFKVEKVHEIQIGETTRSQIKTMLGEPWRTGVDNGYKTWTYAHYKYSAFSQPRTRDLVVRFDEKGIVRSYTYNSTYKEME